MDRTCHRLTLSFVLYKWLKISHHHHAYLVPGVHVRDEPEHADQPAGRKCQALLRSGHQVPAQGFHLKMSAIDDGDDDDCL